ncbi:MAG: NAD-dependent epimerase/dehydratase family protein [Hyphomicrobiales bacterium]
MSEADRPATPPVLVTGGNGFIGSRLILRLVSLGRPVRAIVRRAGTAAGHGSPLVEEIVGDFVLPEVAGPAARGVQYVVHAAATAGPDLEAVRRVNADGTRAMVEAARAAGVRRFVQISTVSVYAAAGLDRADESTPVKTSGEPYGVTKAEGDRVVLDAIARGLPAVILRPGAVLGAHPTSTWAVRVPERIRSRDVKIRIDGGDTIPWVHVDDVVDAILLAMADDRAIGRIYTLVDGHVTWRAYTDRVRSWFGTAPLDVVPREEVPPGGYSTTRFDGSRIRNELGHAPKRTYEEGMAEAEAYWMARGEETRAGG